jgi:hypothetical protein
MPERRLSASSAIRTTVPAGPAESKLNLASFEGVAAELSVHAAEPARPSHSAPRLDVDPALPRAAQTVAVVEALHILVSKKEDHRTEHRFHVQNS